MSKISLKIPNQTEPKQLDCQLAGQQFSITLDGVVHSGQVSVTAPGEGWLHYQGRILPFYLTQKQDTLSIWLSGKTYHLDLVNAASRRAGGQSAAAVSDGAIKAPMPGTVLKVLVKPGDSVEANQPLIIMESMKMEMTLSAPKTGKVEQVHCQENQLVDMGAILVTLSI
ncbi:biotin/lipoyl-containing protein [Vampirovibrio sp.]|uniref:biotin/lipoyl-containing protein n=1 Tax=Vampirovibrio sp. TaxID=2717857 RepID=UPI0035937FE1